MATCGWQCLGLSVRLPFLDEGEGLRGGQRLAEQVALHEIAEMRGQQMALRFGFHALGGHGQAEAVRQCDGGGADGDVIVVAFDVAYKKQNKKQRKKQQKLEI